jgi:hypothetical protein
MKQINNESFEAFLAFGDGSFTFSEVIWPTMDQRLRSAA